MHANGSWWKNVGAWGRRGALALGCFALLTRLGCHGGGGTPDGGMPDGGVDGPVDGPIDAMPDGPIDAMPDGPIDGPPSTAPHPTSITNGDGGHQVRQTSTTTIVILGTNLADVTSVTVGSDVATIDSATATALRATFYTHAGAPLGPVALTLVSPGGTTVTPGALVTTPYVVVPGAGTGRGTYESPTHLCDSSTFGLFIGPQVGDTLDVLGGVHQCGQMVLINGGVTIQGAADGSTIVQGVGGDGFGFFITSDGVPRSTAMRRLTFEEPLAEVSILFGDEDLLLEHIVDAGGVLAEQVGQVEINDYVFNGEGSALRLIAAGLTLTDVVVHCQNSDQASDGLFLGPRRMPFQFGVGTLERVRVEHCARGLVLGPMPGAPGEVLPPSDLGQYQMSGVELLDNQIGMKVLVGRTTLYSPVIHDDELTPQVCSYGLQINHGDVTLIGGEIRAALTGVEVYTTLNGNRFEPHSDLVTDGTEIAGGEVGIDFTGFDSDSDLTMRRTIVRDQTVAAVRVRGYDSYFDLGSTFEAGANALSVVSGHALVDNRNDSLNFRYLDAIGTTLNGHSYAGQTIEGPAEQGADYLILTGSGAIQF